VFVHSRLTGLYRVKSSGGTPDSVFRVSEGEIAWWPQFVPGGREVLFTLSKTADYKDQSQVVALSLDTGERRNLLEGHAARYAATGHLLYAMKGTGNLRSAFRP
jgi:hypothetical protein